MTDIDLTFPHGYVCEVLDELHEGTVPRHFFPDGRAAGQDGINVRVRPNIGEAWIGTFAVGRFGKVGISRVLSMPDTAKLCVVACGAGYIVSVSDPRAWEAVRAIPIIDIRVIQAAELVLFANHTEILAFGKDGVTWRTRRLTWDGLKILSVDDRTLVGEYWDLREEAMQRFEVDLATGAARGGIEP